MQEMSSINRLKTMYIALTIAYLAVSLIIDKDALSG